MRRLRDPHSQLLMGTVLLFVARAGLSLLRKGPVLVADEVGYLMNGRVLSGGVRGQLSPAPYYHGGYSLLIAPLIAVVRDPATGYRLVLVLNALLAASIVPLVYLLLTRCFAVSPRVAVWPSLAAGAYPSITLLSQVAMSENLLFPLLTFWLLAFGCFLRATSERRRILWSAATALSAVWLWATHGRMLVALALTVFALVASVLLDRTRLRACVVAIAILAVGVGVVHALDDFLVDRNWGGHAPSEIDQPLAMFESLGGIGNLARNLVGEGWYLLVATLGALAAFPFGLRTRRRLNDEDLLLALLLLTAIGLLVESALQFPTYDRPDTIIYGRYTEVVVPPLLALALVRFRERRRRLLPATILIGVATVATALLRHGIHPSGTANRWNVASLPAPTFELGPVVLLFAGAVALLAFGLLEWAGRWAPWALAPLVVILFVPTIAVDERSPLLRTQSSFYPAGWTSPAEAAGDAPTIAFDTDAGGELWADQWFLSKSRLVLFAGSSERPPAAFVISSPAWVAAHAALRPTPLWHDRSRDAELVRVRLELRR
jgi:hypothetical protein